MSDLELARPPRGWPPGDHAWVQQLVEARARAAAARTHAEEVATSALERLLEAAAAIAGVEVQLGPWEATELNQRRLVEFQEALAAWQARPLKRCQVIVRKR